MIWLPRLSASGFNWSRWRRFGLFQQLGMACRTGDIVRARSELRRCAIGWARGEDLPCRPKDGVAAVMWLEDGHLTWCHLTMAEFLELFGEENDGWTRLR
jgi:hypothetical protein